MSRGTVPPSDARIRGLEASNAVLRRELRERPNRFRSGFLTGLGIAAVIAALAWSLPAFADPLSISGTLVTLEPAAAPAVAVVTMQNIDLNGSRDDGVYPLAMPGLVIEVEFQWEAGDFGADGLTVIPPDGMICDPLDCRMVVLEGNSGTVLLLEWIGG